MNLFVCVIRRRRSNYNERSNFLARANIVFVNFLHCEWSRVPPLIAYFSTQHIVVNLHLKLHHTRGIHVFCSTIDLSGNYVLSSNRTFEVSVLSYKVLSFRVAYIEQAFFFFQSLLFFAISYVTIFISNYCSKFLRDINVGFLAQSRHIFFFFAAFVRSCLRVSFYTPLGMRHNTKTERNKPWAKYRRRRSKTIGKWKWGKMLYP